MRRLVFRDTGRDEAMGGGDARTVERDQPGGCSRAPVLLAPQTVEAQAATLPPTPPEACLAVETLPVPAGDGPHDVAPAAGDASVWYTAQGAGALGLLDPATGTVETVPLGPGSVPHGVIVGPDGAAWVTDGRLNAIVRVEPTTREVSVWPLVGDNANLNTAVFDADGVLWFTGQNGDLGRLNPAAQPPARR